MTKYRMLAAALATLALGVRCSDKAVYVAAPKPAASDAAHGVRCHIQRDECAGEGISDTQAQPTCAGHRETSNFFAEACPDVGEVLEQACKRVFCPPGDPHIINCNLVDLPVLIPFVSVCSTAAGAPGGPQTSVACQAIFRHCNDVTVQGQHLCSPLNEQPPVQVSTCFDPTRITADAVCRAPFAGEFMGHYDISHIVVADPSCTPAPLTNALAYDLGATTDHVSTASAGFDIPVLGGSAVVNRSCVAPGNCRPSQLVSARMFIGDMDVLGRSLRGVEVTTGAPASIVESGGQFVVPAQGLRLDALGLLDGVLSGFSFVTTDPLQIQGDTTGFRLAGSLNLVLDTPTGPLPLTAAIDVSGTPGADAACATFSHIQRLFGFEDATSYTSSQATLTLGPTPRTQGCAALQVLGAGYMSISGAPFATSELPSGARTLRIDLFIPGSQPNPYWLGALQSYLTCPSLGVFNAYIGQVELTGKPTGSFSTLSMALPSSVVTALQRPASDCNLALALNVNQTNQAWVLDNLRLTP